MSNRITAYFKGRIGVAESVYQNDYGMVIAFDGIELPAHFDCYFSRLNQEEALPGIGADNRVTIPNSILANPGNVTIHIPLHTGEADSEVEYVIYFKVIGRARPIDDGTPAQMTAIEKALALLQNPITNIDQIVEEALSFTGTSISALQAEDTAIKGRVTVLESDNTSNKSRITNTESDLDALEAVVNSIATLPEGSTSGDAELIAARTVGSKTYDNLHTAMDTEFSEVKYDMNSNLVPMTLALKGWQNGTGFVDVDDVMSPGEVLISTKDCILYTDFSKYVISVFYYSSPTNKYPTWKANATSPYTVPANQYFSMIIRYIAGASTLDADDIAYIPTVTKAVNQIGIWEKEQEDFDAVNAKVNIIDGAIETDQIDDVTLVLKGWVNGTGFVDGDEVMSPGEVLQSDAYGTVISTDYGKYEMLIYFFSSPTNKYPQYKGAFRTDYIVPANQWFTFLLRYKSGQRTIDPEDVENIPRVTKCIKNIGIWKDIEGIKDSIETHSDIFYPHIDTVSDYALATQIQDGVRIGNTIYQFTGGGPTIGDSLGHILEIDLETKEIKDEMYHDFGHVSCLSYNESNDTLVVARVSSSTPMIQLYKNFSESLEPEAVLQPSDDNCIVINLDIELLLGRTGFEALFAENSKTLLCFTNKISEYNNYVLLYKVLLGTGDVDLSDEENGYGTFISNTPAEEYNGTCKVISSCWLPSVNRQPQLLRWYKGKLYMLSGNRDTIIHRYRYDSVNDRFLEDAKFYINDLNADGTAIAMEPESLMFNYDATYLGLWDKESPTRMRLLKVEL